MPITDLCPGRLCPPAERPRLSLWSPLWLPAPLALTQAPGRSPGPHSSSRTPGAPVPATWASAPLCRERQLLPPSCCRPHPPSIPSSNVSPSVPTTSPSSVTTSGSPTRGPDSAAASRGSPPRGPLLAGTGGGAVTGKETQAGAVNKAHSGGAGVTGCDQTPLATSSGGHLTGSPESPNCGQAGSGSLGRAGHHPAGGATSGHSLGSQVGHSLGRVSAHTRSPPPTQTHQESPSLSSVTVLGSCSDWASALRMRRGRAGPAPPPGARDGW